MTPFPFLAAFDQEDVDEFSNELVPYWPLLGKEYEVGGGERVRYKEGAEGEVPQFLGEHVERPFASGVGISVDG